MKYCIIVILCCVVLVSCGSNPRKEFVNACYSYAQASCDQHIKYIDDDSTLSKLDKEVRTRATNEFFKMVEEEFKRQEPNKGK